MVARGKEHRHQLLLDRERKSVNAKFSQSERGQEGGATQKKTPKPNPCNDNEKSCHDYALDAKDYMKGDVESNETRTDDDAKSNETGIG